MGWPRTGSNTQPRSISPGQCVTRVILGVATLLLLLGRQTLEGAEPGGNYQLLKAVGMSSLTHHESYCPCICFSADICSSLSAKPAKPLQQSKKTMAWGEKEDQVGSSRMKHMLEEEKEKICTLCNL